MIVGKKGYCDFVSFPGMEIDRTNKCKSEDRKINPVLTRI